MTYQWQSIIVSTILFLSAQVLSKENSSTQISVDTPEAAVEQAYRYLGFPELRSRKATIAAKNCHLLDSADINIPFLYSSVRGRPVWRVTLSDVKVSLPSKRQWWIETHNPKSYEALIDSATGALYIVYSVPPSNDPDVAPEPNAEEATRQLRDGHEEYVGFPASPPAVSFYQAMDAAVFARPLEAKELIAHYVLYSHLGRKPFPAWCITGKGITTFDMIKNPESREPLRYRNRGRCVVNAETGKVYMCDNSPTIPRGK